MHWSYEELMQLPTDIYDELVLWVRDGQAADAARAAEDE